MQNIEIQRSLRNILSGNRVGFDPSDADKEALKLLDDNTGSFAVEYAKNTPDVDPRVKQAMESIPTAFSQEKFREAVQSVEEPTPEAAEQKREGLLEASTFLPGVGGAIDVAKTVLDKESTLTDIGLASLSFLPGGKLAGEALKKADKFVPIFPKPERIAGVKGGQYIDTTTNTDITNKNIAKASISVSPEGKPSFLGDIKEVEKVGSVGKGKTQIKTNLFKKKAGWKWTKPVKGYEEAPTLISVQQKGKHYYTLNTNFPSGVNLKRYENLPSEPRLRPTLTGELDFGEAIGEISVRGKIHPVYDTIQAKEKGGMVNMENGGILGGDLPPEAIANGNVIQGAPVGEVAVPGGGGPVDDGVPTQLPEGTFVLNAASVEYHGTKHINDLIKNAIRELIKEGVQISGEDINPDDDVPVAISNGEYIIPPEVAKKIGIKKLEDMNERGLEYRKKIEEQEKQKVAAQQEAMNSFVGAPIQSEQQMPMQDGGEASPPDEAMPQVPEEDTPMFNQEQRDILLNSLLQEKLKDFLDQSREKNITQQQEQKQLQELKEKGMIPNPETGGIDLMAEALKVPLISPKNLPLGSRPPERDVGDPKKPYEPVPMTFAAIGGQILPQVQSTLAGAGIGANAFPASPQEAFLNTPITGSVLQNLGNAVPLGAMQQPQQQAGFMQPMAQKKNPEIARFSFANGDIVPQQLSDVTEEERDKVAAYELTGGNVEIWKKVKAGTYGEDLHTYGLNPEYDLKNKKLMKQKNIKKYIRYKTYDAKTNQLLTYLDHTGNRTVLGVNIEALPKGHKFKNAEVNKPFGIEEVSTEQDKIYDRAVEQAATFSKKYDIQNSKAKRFVRDVYFNFGMGKEGGKGGFMNKMPGAFKALTQKDYPILALELQYNDPFSSSKQETSYFRPGTNINVRALDNINMLKSIIPVPKTKPTQEERD